MIPTIAVRRPIGIASNPETAASNVFQSDEGAGSEAAALAEFDGFVGALREAEITTLEVPATAAAPDATFVNNWFSTHPDGTVVIYPMMAPSRRRERDLPGLMNALAGFEVSKVLDYTFLEEDRRFLEGTGSLIFDIKNQIAIAALSPRTDLEAARIVTAALGLELIKFETEFAGVPVYHTNVVLSLGSDFAVICSSVCRDWSELRVFFEVTGREVIEIDEDQLCAFCGNILEVGTTVVMSSRAYHAFRGDQLAIIGRNRRIVHAPLDTIEQLGGGSARCMMAEIWLPITTHH